MDPKIANSFEIPEGLVEAILRGNCVAFVGSGFSQAAGLPTWAKMLSNVLQAASAPPYKVPAETLTYLSDKLRGMSNVTSSDTFDLIAQMLEDALGTAALEALVAAELSLAHPPQPAMVTRLRLLDDIPFRAILTSNYDCLLMGSTPLPGGQERPEYAAVLRQDSAAREEYLSGVAEMMRSETPAPHEPYCALRPRPGRPIIKIHGRVEDAIGSVSAAQGLSGETLANAMVMTRTGYRKLLHHSPGYGLFLRSVLSTCTVLYMGFSFTDGYLNELRGEVLSMLFGSPASYPAQRRLAPEGEKQALGQEKRTIGYAIVPDKAGPEKAFFARHEGVEILTWNTDVGDSVPYFGGLERYLERILARTSPAYQLGMATSGRRLLIIEYPSAATPSTSSVSEVDNSPSLTSPRSLPVPPRVLEPELATSPSDFEAALGAVFQRAARVFASASSSSSTPMQPVVVSSLLEAQEQLQAYNFDAVVCVFGEDDTGAGRHWWWEVLLAIRDAPLRNRVPLIVYSSQRRERERRALCLSNGCFDFATSFAGVIRAVTRLFVSDSSAGGSGAAERPYKLSSPLQKPPKLSYLGEEGVEQAMAAAGTCAATIGLDTVSTPASGAGAAAVAALDTVPLRGYAMPTPPFRIKKQEFAAWDIDHTRFEIKRMLGKGSYGVVAMAFDHLTNNCVAIKKINAIFDVFETSKRIYRELRILRALQHPYIVKLLHVSCPGIADSSVDLLSFQDLYIVFEYADTDLAKLIKDETQALTEQHIRWFLYQQLVALKAIHDARILHRDIKPANVLLSEQCDVKMCDFGLARSFDEENDGSLVIGDDDALETGMEEAGGGGGAAAAAHAHAGLPPMQPARQMTRHVQTRWYRAPELPLYNDGRYSPHIDTWSLGCCFAEMLDMQASPRPGVEPNAERKPLFPGGEAYEHFNKLVKKDQLQVIFENMGRPEAAAVASLRTPEARAMVAATLAEMDRRPVPFVPLEQRFPCASAEALDLLRKMLSFTDATRVTLEEALEHPFLKQVKRPLPSLFPPPAGPLHIGTINADNVRALLVEEIRHWNPQLPADWEAVVLRQRLRQGGGVGGGVSSGGGVCGGGGGGNSVGGGDKTAAVAEEQR